MKTQVRTVDEFKSAERGAECVLRVSVVLHFAEELSETIDGVGLRKDAFRWRNGCKPGCISDLRFVRLGVNRQFLRCDPSSSQGVERGRDRLAQSGHCGWAEPVAHTLRRTRAPC
jgi:hypothetical protein